MGNYSMIKRLVERNYFLANSYQYWQFWLADRRGQEPIIVFQMGKVGSSSIIASLRALRLGPPILHVHTLTQAGLDHAEQLYNRGKDQLPRSRHLLVSRHLLRRLSQPPNGKPKRYKVITLVREPVARNISSLFQIVDLLLPNFQARYAAGEISPATLSDLFLERFPPDSKMTLHWFDREMKGVFGVDVFACEFPTARGYSIYREERADVLLLKLEKLNDCAEEAFKEFLNLDNFKLLKTNVAAEKAYYQAYQEFVDKVFLPPSYIDTIYESKQARHFYSDDELKVFKARWLRR